MSNPWKLTAIGMALVATTAMVTGLVVANRTPDTYTTPAPPPPPSAATAPSRPAPRAVASASTGSPSTGSASTSVASAVPTPAVVKACNDQAAAGSGPRNTTTEVVKDGAIGAVVGAAVGAAGGAVVDGGKGAGKGAAIGGVVGAGAGALFGVNENRKHDAAYRDAYAACLRTRGYRG